MFLNCQNLQYVGDLIFQNSTNLGKMFQNCFNLRSVGKIYADSVTYLNSPFSLPDGYFYNDLTDFGGFLNLKCSLTSDRNLKKLPNLTKESCINVLNGLYDFVAAGETPNSDQGQLKVAQSFIDKVGDEISIGINKGWQITV